MRRLIHQETGRALPLASVTIVAIVTIVARRHCPCSCHPIVAMRGGECRHSIRHMAPPARQLDPAHDFWACVKRMPCVLCPESLLCWTIPSLAVTHHPNSRLCGHSRRWDPRLLPVHEAESGPMREQASSEQARVDAHLFLPSSSDRNAPIDRHPGRRVVLSVLPTKSITMIIRVLEAFMALQWQAGVLTGGVVLAVQDLVAVGACKCPR